MRAFSLVNKLRVRKAEWEASTGVEPVRALSGRAGRVKATYSEEWTDCYLGCGRVYNTGGTQKKVTGTRTEGL